MTKRPNPFSVLKLPTEALNRDIVDKGQELSDLAENDTEKMLCRWAMERLLTNPSERLIYELFEIPGTQYENEAWERFERRFRRNPLDRSVLLKDTTQPAVGDINIPSLISLIVQGLIPNEKGDAAIVIKGSPFRAGSDKSPIEVQDAIFG